MFRPATKDPEVISITLRYDYQYGGFYVDNTLPSNNETDFKYQKVFFSARHTDYIQSTEFAGDDVPFSDDRVVAMVSSYGSSYGSRIQMQLRKSYSVNMKTLSCVTFVVPKLV